MPLPQKLIGLIAVAIFSVLLFAQTRSSARSAQNTFNLAVRDSGKQIQRHSESNFGTIIQGPNIYQRIITSGSQTLIETGMSNQTFADRNASQQAFLGKDKTIIDRALDKPVTVTVIKGDTFLQRDLTEYLNLTLGMNNNPTDDLESDALTDVSVLRDYFMRPHPSVSTTQKYFDQASNEYGVPVSLLMVIGQIENNWTQTGPTIDRGWGVMHLVQNSYCNTLGEAAELTGVPEQALKDDAKQNIRGAAALIAKYAGDEKRNFNKLEDWFPAIARFSGLISPELREMQARNYLETLREGVRAETVWGEEIIIESEKNEMNGRYPNTINEYTPQKPLSSDYGPALTNLTPCNYATGRNHSIDTWVNHWIGTGTYLGAISRFHDCTQEVSAQFVIKNNGEITQVVLVANTAWHCGVVGQPFNNSRSIGVEHDAIAANPGMWNSTAMLNASATMARYFKNQIGFPTTQNSSPGICGHNDMPGTSTQCPGPLPWSTWMSYFNGGVTPPANDNCSNAIVLNSNTACSFTSGTVLNATASGLSKPSCDGFPSPNLYDVWYKFTATSSSQMVTVDPSTSTGDPVVSVHSSCGGSPIGCRDGGGTGITENLSLSGLTVGSTYYVRIYDYGSVEPTGSDANFQICVTSGAPCSYSISPTSQSFSANGGSNSVGVTTSSGCAWTATSNSGFISITSGSSGSGNGTVNYSVTANSSSSQRTGTMTIAGQTFTVTQSGISCNYSLSPTSQSFSANGGSNSVGVTTSSGCAWTATSNSSFITIDTGSSGSGNGTVNYSVTANSSTSQRTGTMTIAGQTFTVTQSGISCNYSLSPTSQSFSANGGSNSVGVTTSSGCAWTATSNSGFISITSGSSGSGNGTVNYSVTANSSSSQRTGTMTIAGQTFTVTQSGISCNYSLSPTSQSFSANGGSNSVGVTASSGCAWTATSNSSFITIDTGSSGSGNGTVNYSVTANSSTSQRTGTMTIAGQTFSVTQSGVSCNYSLSPTSQSFSANGGSNSVGVTASSGCAWTATSNSSFINIDTGSSGSGNGTVNYSVAANSSSSQRTGTMSIAGQTFTVTQSAGGGGCASAISLGQTINGTLTTSDCIFSGTTRYVDVYNFSGTAGQQIAVALNSSTFDTYLYLLNPDNQLVAEDDDSGGGTNSLIPASGSLTLPTTGSYTIYATSFSANGTTGSTGAYTISLLSGAGSATMTVGVFRPSNGIVYLKNTNVGGFADLNFVYGVAGDKPIAGDWNGDGIDTLGIYRDGTFYLRNSNTTGAANIVFNFGASGDLPVAGDWNGDGVDTIGVYNPNTGVFFLRNSNSSGPADITFVLGNPGDVPIAGDWNGDGITTTGVFRPSNGIVYLKNTNASGVADIYLVYGNAGDLPLAGDWNGDGITTVAIYRNGVFYLRNSNTQGVADLVFALGNNGDLPIAGNWDGLP